MIHRDMVLAEPPMARLSLAAPLEIGAAWRFQFHRPGPMAKLDPEVVRHVSDTLEQARRSAGDPETLHEFSVRARHEQGFVAFLHQFQFSLTETERLAALALYKAEAPGAAAGKALRARAAVLAVALEYCSRYRHAVAADLDLMRFYQTLHYFNPRAAEAFAEVLRVAPDLEAGFVFRNIARDYDITRALKPVAPGECIRHFNLVPLIEGLEAFAVDDHVGLRRAAGRSSHAYAEAMLRISDFSRFVLCAYTDPRQNILRLIQAHGALRSLCVPLIRTYLAHHDADPLVLESEIQQVILGRPRFPARPVEARRG